MLGWILFYILSFSLVAAPKKISQIAYPFLFWIFVGFRDNIGTDYPLTLMSVERSYLPFSDIALNFFGYNALDLEAVHKFIAMFMCSFGMQLNYYYVILAGIEAMIISYLLQKSYHYKLVLVFLICIFTINYPMNAVRQGLSFLLVVLAILISTKKTGKEKSKIYSTLMYLLGALSHYGSMPALVLYYFKFNNIRYYFIAAVIFLISVCYIDYDLISTRYGVEDSDIIYQFSGGFRLILFVSILMYAYKTVLKRRYNSQDIIILLGLLIGVFVHATLLRIFVMYANILIFKILFESDDVFISKKQKYALLCYPLIFFAFEILEILRTPKIAEAGVWFPYDNWLF